MNRAVLALVASVSVFLLSECESTQAVPQPINLHEFDWQAMGTPGAHDPTMIRTASGWYVYYTGPGILSKWSADGITWFLNGSVFGGTPAWTEEYVSAPSANIWAPDISYRNGTFYLYYSVSRFGENESVIGLATNKTLDVESDEYEWVDQGYVISSNKGDSYNAIDPNLVVDEDGQTWLALGSHWSGIKLVRLNRRTMKPDPDTELISIAARPDSRAIEAPYIIYRDGWYYLFVSFDQCCRGVQSTYKIAVGRSRTIEGDYADRSGVPMLRGGGTVIIESGNRWRGPGHCDVYGEAGRYVLVHHAYDAANNGAATLRIAPLMWDSDGWPQVP